MPRSSPSQAPHRRQRVPVKRAPRAADEPRMLSSDEKRELILAHAAARSQKPPEWGMAYYIGIAASCLVILTGWWLTLGGRVRTILPLRQDGVVQTVEHGWQKLTSGLASDQKKEEASGNTFGAKVEVVKQEYQQALLQAQAMKTAAAEIDAMTTTTKK